jgi:DNA-binding GntR family transcriptional regulator
VPQPVRERIVPAQLERRVYERIRDEILSGALSPGVQLVEARIAQELGVSKTPVREALIRLSRDGLVAIEPYRGARIIEPTPDDIREILELRMLLECHTIRELAIRRQRDVIDALRSSIDDSYVAVSSGRERALSDALTAFSDIQAAACGNSRMARLLVDLRSVLLLIGNASMRATGRVTRSIDEHETILAAVIDGDPDAAVRATIQHIRSVERDCLVAVGHDDEPSAGRPVDIPVDAD